MPFSGRFISFFTVNITTKYTKKSSDFYYITTKYTKKSSDFYFIFKIRELEFQLGNTRIAKSFPLFNENFILFLTPMLLACYKPSGISSFDVVKIIRTHFQNKV